MPCTRQGLESEAIDAQLKPCRRRAKGTRKYATDFDEEMAAIVALTVYGGARRVSRQRAIIMGVADNASRGVVSAMKIIFDLQQKIGGLLPPQPVAASNDYDCSKLDADELDHLIMLLSKVMGVEDEAHEIKASDPLFCHIKAPLIIDYGDQGLGKAKALATTAHVADAHLSRPCSVTCPVSEGQATQLEYRAIMILH